MQGEILKEIHRQGLVSIAVDKNANAIFRGEADHFLNISTRRPLEIIEALEAADLKEKITHCITVATDMTASVAFINQELKLDGLSLTQAKVTNNKGEMRKFLKENHFSQPEFKTSSSKKECYDWLEKQAGRKFVVKPVDNMGARGVIYLPGKKDISFSFELAQRESISNEVIIEEFIEGNELSVDALVYEGKCYLTGLADRIIERLNDMYFLEIGHNLPTRQNKRIIKKIACSLQDFADALGALEGKPYHGALKADMIVTKDEKIYINEIASRLSGGFMSTHTFRYASGLNLMAAYLDLIFKRKVAFHSFIDELSYPYHCIERAIVVSPGLIKEINIPPKGFKTEEGVVRDIHLNYSQGDILYPVRNNLGKFGHVVIQSQGLRNAEKTWNSFKRKILVESSMSILDQMRFKKQARKNFNPKFCWVCRECDGFNCASSVPGMGGVDKMLTFQENIRALRDIKILPRYIEKIKKPSGSENVPQLDISQIKTQLSILNVPMQAPVLTAPITGSITNMGGSIAEWDYAYESGLAARMLGLIPTFGDGASLDKYLTGLRAIEKLGTGFPVFKPRTDINELKKRIHFAEKHGAKAWGMDIDAIWFKTMLQKNQRTERKSLSELIELRNSSDLPFFLKGIMRIEDAELACQAGASAIIVSNHGGRVLDSMPGTASVLPEIAKFVGKEFPHVEVLVDGGIRSGTDIFKMLSLGAKAVLIGRPLVIFTVAAQRIGAYYLLQNYIQEFKKVLLTLGLSSIEQIDREHILRQ